MKGRIGDYMRGKDTQENITEKIKEPVSILPHSESERGEEIMISICDIFYCSIETCDTVPIS